jgi:hypothetical protein
MIRDADTFSQEWQVREYEPSLLQDHRFPQFPEQCIPLSKGMEEIEQHLSVEKACGHVQRPEKECCVFNVMATGEYGVAAVIYGKHSKLQNNTNSGNALHSPHRFYLIIHEEKKSSYNEYE